MLKGKHGRGWQQQGKCEGTKKGKHMETAEALSSLSATSGCQQLYRTEGQSEQIMHSFRVSTTLPFSLQLPTPISPVRATPLSGVFLTSPL